MAQREVIDWQRVAIRILGIGVACVVGAPVAWLVGRALGGERSIVGWLGFGLLAFVFLSAVVVASSALRAMFRTGRRASGSRDRTSASHPRSYAAAGEAVLPIRRRATTTGGGPE